MFDPYRKWLGIPPECRPPTHYQLLGIAPDERDLEVIDAAKICLMDPAKRAEYDADLKRKGLGGAAAHSTPPAGADTVAGMTDVAPVNPRPAPAPQPRRVLSPQRAESTAPRAAAPRPLPPPVDLDELAAKAGLSGRRRAGPRVQLPSRQKQAMPAYYWQIPLAVGALTGMLIVAVAISRSSRPQLEEQAFRDPGALDESAQVESLEPGAPMNAPDARTPDLQPAVGPQASAATPERIVPRVPGSQESPVDPRMTGAGEADALSFSQANSGSPTAFPDEADGGDSTVSLPVPATDPLIVFAQGASSFVAVAQTVYDLSTGDAVGKTGAFQARGRNALRALSPDGKYYASAEETRSLNVEVRSCESGDWLYSLPLEGSFVKLTLLEFGAPGQLVTSARFGNGQRVGVWSLSDGSQIKELLVEPFERSQAALSADGRMLAIATSDSQILLYDLTQKPSGQKARPKLQIPLSPTEFGAATVDGLHFSPDGEELLAVLDGGARIQGWNTTGELTFEQTSGVDLRAVWTGARVYEGPAIEWHPGGRGWLLGGHFFFDRELRRVIWMLQTGRDADARMRFLDAGRLMTLRSDGVNRRLADISIPWERIDRALLAVHGDQPSHLGPRDPVSLDLRVARVAGGWQKEEVRDEIERMVGARLRIENVSMAPERSTQLRVTYEEAQTSRAVETETQGELRLRLYINNGAKEVWTAGIVASVSSETEELQPAKRTELYWRLSTRLHQTPLPYFIPKSAELTSLPAIIRP